MKEYHNLPNRPYEKFFGRSDLITRIQETLIEGGTFIASIDGVGGIGKTALAYHFCKEVLIPQRKFSYIVWITSKESVFDPFSKETLVKYVKNNFNGIETLIDATLQVVGMEDYIEADFFEKREFFECEILKKENIFFVLDNLENIDDMEFFDYITKGFNRFSGINRNLKVLTTSRKRKRIVDFPIEIEGLTMEDALMMLKYLASKHSVKELLNTSDTENVKIIQRVGNIPLGIEFIVGQMALGKQLGSIYSELEGYPSLEDVSDKEDKKKRLSEIILFSFKNMYETLDDEHQYIFKIIAALQKNKRPKDRIDFELFITITDYSKFELNKILENLMDNKLITLTDNEYSISQMGINFVRQYYEGFASFENSIVGIKEKLSRNIYKVTDHIDRFLENIKVFLEENKYEEAESSLLNYLDLHNDPRLYYELASIQKTLNKFHKAGDNYKIATNLEPYNAKIWYDWINMEDVRQRHNIALGLSSEALEKTGNDISIVIQMINIYKFKRDYVSLREGIEKFLIYYNKENQQDSYLKLLRHWKTIEYALCKENIPDKYIDVAEQLIDAEQDNEIKIHILSEMLKIAKNKNMRNKIYKIEKRIKSTQERIIRSLGALVKNLNQMFNSKEYEKSKKKARRILHWFDEENHDDSDIKHYQNALRVLMQILSTEKEYEKLIDVFEMYQIIGYRDDACIQIYEKSKKVRYENKINELIGNISTNIQSSEINLRRLVMWYLDYDENNLIKAVQAKGKEDWIERWNTTRNKALTQGGDIIHYSDLSHLRALISWFKNPILTKISDKQQRSLVDEKLIKSVKYLEEYVSKERNETFHSRLQLLELKGLEEILVDTRRLLDTTSSIVEILDI